AGPPPPPPPPRPAVCRPVLLLAVPCGADNGPRGRGPDSDGVSGEMNLPAEWDATKNTVWKLRLPGAGSSTPAVWGDRLFLTSADGGDLVLVCIGTGGKELWKRKLGAGSGRMVKGDESSPATSSPSTDGKHVFAL